MAYYVGLDVSLKEVFITIMDKEGKILKEGMVLNEIDQICSYLFEYKGLYSKIAMESGQLSIYMCKQLKEQGYNVICVDARHMAAGLQARINKNDKNDARGIANMLRAGLYKEVYIKNDEECRLKILLSSRRQLVEQRKCLRNSIRGLLKIHGIRIQSNLSDKRFCSAVEEHIAKLEKIDSLAFNSLLNVLDSITNSMSNLDKQITTLARTDKTCNLIMTVPGVGCITAMTFITTIGDPSRFKNSSSVGAYLGITPKQYSSGEIDRHGAISKMGSSECRSMLYEAAHSLLSRSKVKCDIKKWGNKIKKKKGNKKAVVAVARKMAVVMHRMIMNQTTFCPQMA